MTEIWVINSRLFSNAIFSVLMFRTDQKNATVYENAYIYSPKLLQLQYAYVHRVYISVNITVDIDRRRTVIKPSITRPRL